MDINGEIDLNNINIVNIARNNYTNDVFIIDDKGDNLVEHSIMKFDKEIFDLCLLMTLNGAQPTFTFDSSINPIFLQQSFVEKIMEESRSILYSLLANNFTKSTREQLDKIGYKKIEISTDQIWLEPFIMKVHIENNIFRPEITYKISCEDLSDWFRDNFHEISDIFPILKQLDEFFLCLVIVCAFRKNAVDLSVFENSAMRLLDTKRETFEKNYSNSIIGIRSLHTIYNSSNVFFQINFIGMENLMQESLTIALNVNTKRRLEYGFRIFLGQTSTINFLYRSIHAYISHFHIGWLELYSKSERLKNSNKSLLECGFIDGTNYILELKVIIKPSDKMDRVCQHLSKLVI